MATGNKPMTDERLAEIRTLNMLTVGDPVTFQAIHQLLAEVERQRAVIAEQQWVEASHVRQLNLLADENEHLVTANKWAAGEIERQRAVIAEQQAEIAAMRS